jgi:hypothetical protein
MASYNSKKISFAFLDNNPSARFVYGDDLQKTRGKGSASLRSHPNSLGFITKKFSDTADGAFYRPEEYQAIFFEELDKLKTQVEKNPKLTYYISQLGSGEANRYKIWETLIKTNLLKTLEGYPNVVFCFKK